MDGQIKLALKGRPINMCCFWGCTEREQPSLLMVMGAHAELKLLSCCFQQHSKSWGLCEHYFDLGRNTVIHLDFHLLAFSLAFGFLARACIFRSEITPAISTKMMEGRAMPSLPRKQPAGQLRNLSFPWGALISLIFKWLNWDELRFGVLVHPQFGLLCSEALPFFPRKNTSLVLLQPKTIFLTFH